MARVVRSAAGMIGVALLATAACTPRIQPGSCPCGAAARKPARPASVSVPVDPRGDTPTASLAASSNQPAGTAEDSTGPAAGASGPALFDSGYEKDNQSCLVCHIDLQDELISSAHLRAGITCMGCHGDSDVHRADEYNIMRPDVIWGRAEMEPFCKQCHKQHMHPEKVEEFRQQWLDKRRPNGRWVQQESVCTDCHGNHAIVTGEGNFK
jgi:hypothetical protein